MYWAVSWAVCSVDCLAAARAAKTVVHLVERKVGKTDAMSVDYLAALLVEKLVV